MDEARLRQELLRRRLVEGDRVRGEVFEDLDPLPFLAAPRMDRQALEIQEDLDTVLHPRPGACNEPMASHIFRFEADLA